MYILRSKPIRREKRKSKERQSLAGFSLDPQIILELGKDADGWLFSVAVIMVGMTVVVVLQLSIS